MERLKLPSPTLNTKLTRASNCCWQMPGHSQLTTASAAFRSLLSSCSASAAVIASPSFTPRVWP
ncbi:MAG: hypothetical protein LUD02_02585 [Tannerellaceae bacterium]|nr:hypothetical protein [Tannerellaceae bacterium]